MFFNYIPVSIISIILKGEDIDWVIDEIVLFSDFRKSDTEAETYESIEELKHPQQHEDESIVFLDDLNENKEWSSKTNKV